MELLLLASIAYSVTEDNTEDRLCRLCRTSLGLNEKLNRDNTETQKLSRAVGSHFLAQKNSANRVVNIEARLLLRKRI